MGRKNKKKDKAEELVLSLGTRLEPGMTDDELYALLKEHTSDSLTIDRALEVLNGVYNEDEGNCH